MFVTMQIYIYTHIHTHKMDFPVILNSSVKNVSNCSTNADDLFKAHFWYELITKKMVH